MKFLNLLKKELKELINAQMIIGLVVTIGLLLALGQIMSNVVNEASSESGEVNIADHDNTDYTKTIINSLEESGFKVNLFTEDNTDRAALLNELKIQNLIIIPEGFSDTIVNQNKGGVLEVVNGMKSSAALASLNDKSSAAIELITQITKDYIMSEKGLSSDEISAIDSPVTLNEVTVVSGKSANVGASVLTGFISSQGMIIPLVVFILVMFTSQMIISAISTEKIDKTLETLLSAPVSRLSVLSSKMLAAAIVALVNAGVYMIGFTGYMSSFMGNALNSSAAVGEALTMNDILKDLGLKIGVEGYALIGLQMFMTIMISLSVSLILGAMVTDTKSAQTVLMPIMICAMIPYFISMLYDINLLSPVVKTLIYAIPFTHTFTAMSNIMFGKMDLYWFGLIYQIILFAICMFFALKLFTSDKIFTISLNFGQKRKIKKSKK